MYIWWTLVIFHPLLSVFPPPSLLKPLLSHLLSYLSVYAWPITLTRVLEWVWVGGCLLEHGKRTHGYVSEESYTPIPRTISCQEDWDLLHDEILMGMILCRFWQDNNSFSEFMGTMAMSCPKDVLLGSPTHSPCISSSRMFRRLGSLTSYESLH